MINSSDVVMKCVIDNLLFKCNRIHESRDKKVKKLRFLVTNKFYKKSCNTLNEMKMHCMKNMMFRTINMLRDYISGWRVHMVHPVTNLVIPLENVLFKILDFLNVVHVITNIIRDATEPEINVFAYSDIFSGHTEKKYIDSNHGVTLRKEFFSHQGYCLRHIYNCIKYNPEYP